MFEIQQWNPEAYRAQTRKSSMVVIVIFASLAMLFSTLAVQLFGTAGGDNFRWNLGGVITGVLLTAAIQRLYLVKQPWMAAGLYGWQLKRSLMSITNIMHCVEEGVAAGDEQAMLLLRFYHLGATQMFQLDGNSEGLSQMVHDIDRHRERMLQLGLDIEQNRLYPGWVETVKSRFPAKKK